MDNDIIQRIYKMFKDSFHKLYENQSTTLIIYRVIPSFCREIIIKLINLSDKIVITDTFYANNFCNFSKDNQEIELITSYLNILLSLRILYRVPIDIKDNKSINSKKTFERQYDNSSINKSLNNDYNKIQNILNKNLKDVNINGNNTCFSLDEVDTHQYIFNSNFKKNLMLVLFSGFESKTFTPYYNINLEIKKKSEKELYLKGIQVLDKFLEKIIDLEDYKCIENETDQLKFLLFKNLIRKVSNTYKMTGICLAILLENRETQLKNIILRYIDYVYKLKSPEDCYKLAVILFELSCLEIGLAYKLPANLSENITQCLVMLNYIGLIQYKVNYIFVTPLTKSLFECNEYMLIKEKIFYVETNFRVYIYKEKNNYLNGLVFALIKIIVNILFDFKEFLVADITRKNIRGAFKKGLTANQIIKFLSSHSKNALPSNIEQQIIIWEEEKNAIIADKCIYFWGFDSKEDYKLFIKCATERKMFILWKNDIDMKCCVHRRYEAECHLILRDYNN